MYSQAMLFVVAVALVLQIVRVLCCSGDILHIKTYDSLISDAPGYNSENLSYNFDLSFALYIDDLAALSVTEIPHAMQTVCEEKSCCLRSHAADYSLEFNEGKGQALLKL